VAALAIIVPIALLVYLFNNPDAVQTMGAWANTLVITAIAWLLIGIDGSFKLGIVSNLIPLAMGIKELG